MKKLIIAKTTNKKDDVYQFTSKVTYNFSAVSAGIYIHKSTEGISISEAVGFYPHGHVAAVRIVD